MDLLVRYNFALRNFRHGRKFWFGGPHHFTPEFDVCVHCCVHDSTTTSSKDEKDTRETITTNKCDTPPRNGAEPSPLPTALVAMLRKEERSDVDAVISRNNLRNFPTSVAFLLISIEIAIDGDDCGPNFLSPLIQALTLGFFDVPPSWLVRLMAA